MEPISDEQMDKIAEKAAEKALEKVYTEVGRSVITKVMWVIGVAAIGLFFWLTSIGVISKP
jgi:hypothetical protein